MGTRMQNGDQDSGRGPGCRTGTRMQDGDQDAKCLQAMERVSSSSVISLTPSNGRDRGSLKTLQRFK